MIYEYTAQGELSATALFLALGISFVSGLRTFTEPHGRCTRGSLLSVFFHDPLTRWLVDQDRLRQRPAPRARARGVLRTSTFDRLADWILTDVVVTFVARLNWSFVKAHLSK